MCHSAKNTDLIRRCLVAYLYFSIPALTLDTLKPLARQTIVAQYWPRLPVNVRHTLGCLTALHFSIMVRRPDLANSYICIVLFCLYITATRVGLDVCICSSLSGIEPSKEKSSLAYLFDA